VDPRFRGDDGEWNNTLAAFRRAEAAVLALEGGPDEAAFGRAHDRFNLLFRRLLAHPAPDVAALATKLEIAVAAELADLTYGPPALATLAEDARRLSFRSS
jgi:biopolymer transport protein ExbB/TolQ